METVRYAKRSAFIDVVRLTADNFAEVAEWCNGTFWTSSNGDIRVTFGDDPLVPGSGYEVRLGDGMAKADHGGFQVWPAEDLDSGRFVEIFVEIPVNA